MTGNGFPSPDGLGLGTGVVYEATRTETERQLVSIWEEVLGRDGIGVRDNFFDLGGHSLKATRLASLIHKVFEVRITLKDLFLHTVLEDQASLIRAEKWIESTGEIELDKRNFFDI